MVDELKKMLSERIVQRRLKMPQSPFDGDIQGDPAVPRDHARHADLQLMANHQRRFPGFDYKIISISTPYARELSVREVRLRSSLAASIRARSDLGGDGFNSG